MRTVYVSLRLGPWTFRKEWPSYRDMLNDPVVMTRLQMVCAGIVAWLLLMTVLLYMERPGAAIECETTQALPSDVYQYLDRTSKSKLTELCTDESMLHIGGLEQLVNNWKHSKHKACRELHELFTSILRVESRSGYVNLTQTLRGKMLRWFGGNEDLVNQAQKQTMIFVTNRLTYEATVFNPIREKRPVVKPDITDTMYVEKLAKESAEDCDFCNYQSATSPDVYGRIESTHCYTAANAFKLDAFHSLIILREHHPLKLTEEAIVDVFQTAEKWFHLIHKHNPDYIYPVLYWDFLPHASASQIHPHLHVILTNTGYAGTQDQLIQVTRQYSRKSGGRDYIRDLTRLHDILGLTVKHGATTAYSSLTPRKDHEVVITSKRVDQEFSQMTFYLTQAYFQLEQLCFSMALIFPPLRPVSPVHPLPAILRSVSRGSVSEVRSDISSLELFSHSDVNCDPFSFGKTLRDAVKKRGGNHRDNTVV